jgi:hypothetical protein
MLPPKLPMTRTRRVLIAGETADPQAEFVMVP